MAKTAAKGTIDNPYSMSECEKMLDAGTWPGGYVRDDAGTVSYVMKSVTVWGYSGCGSGCDWHGSDYEFCTGSYEWHEPDTDEKGCEDDKKDLPTGNEGGTGAGGNTGNIGGGTGGWNGNTGGGTGAGGNTGNTGGGTGGDNNMAVLTQSEFDKLEKVCSLTPTISTMLKNLYDAKRIVTYPTGYISASGRYNSVTGKLELSKSSVNDVNRNTIFHELVHYVQDTKKTLTHNSCNSEFQAHLMTCYILLYKGDIAYKMPGVDDHNEDREAVIYPVSDYFDDTNGATYRKWSLLEEKLNSANWTEIVNHFRESWKGKSVKPAYVNPYNAEAPFYWREMFEAFGLLY